MFLEAGNDQCTAKDRDLPGTEVLLEALELLAEEELSPELYGSIGSDAERLLAVMLDNKVCDRADQIVMLSLLRYAHEYGYLPSAAAA